MKLLSIACSLMTAYAKLTSHDSSHPIRDYDKQNIINQNLIQSNQNLHSSKETFSAYNAFV